MGYNREDARELARALLGEEFVSARMSSESDPAQWGAELGDIAGKFAFGEIWNRPGLDRRSRSLITLAILTTLRATQEIKYHVIGALNNGLTPKEIEEVLIHCLAYSGVPSVASVIPAVMETLKEKRAI